MVHCQLFRSQFSSRLWHTILSCAGICRRPPAESTSQIYPQKFTFTKIFRNRVNLVSIPVATSVVFLFNTLTILYIYCII